MLTIDDDMNWNVCGDYILPKEKTNQAHSNKKIRPDSEQTEMKQFIWSMCVFMCLALLFCWLVAHMRWEKKAKATWLEK